MTKIAALYVGSSLLPSLRRAGRELSDGHGRELRIAAHNCTLPLSDEQWSECESDISQADLVFVIHVTDSENAARIGAALDRYRPRHRAVIVLNCLGDLMRRMRLGTLSFSSRVRAWQSPDGTVMRRLAGKFGLWMASHARHSRRRKPETYLSLASRLPSLLRFVPSTGRFSDIKHLLTLYCYFLQPTPANIQSMILYAVRQYVPGWKDRTRILPPEQRPALGIYHPDAPVLFEKFEAYEKWYCRRRHLDPENTVGLLLMRPQVVSGACRHYDELIRAIEEQGLAVLPILSSFMDNRDAVRAFLLNRNGRAPRVSQMLSLTGFSFVGGPAMNDAAAATEFLTELNRPLHGAVSLEVQRLDEWLNSGIGLNPVQTAMQVAIPEIDGSTEPFVFGGVAAGADEPEAIEDRCRRIARRLARWNRLQRLPRRDVRLALVLHCFPPNKGNIGTAADLDVFESLCAVLKRLEAEGYGVEAPATADEVRRAVSGPEGSLSGGHLAQVAYKLSAQEYFTLCPHVGEIETEWGPAPGDINSQGGHILIYGARLGNAFLGVQPSFGYEGDPMRMIMARGCTPHHGFMGFYVYLEKVFQADAVIHVGTHGALEFMPGKQVGLSGRCWPDRLIGELPHVYIYSVNNPSEGSIAKRRSYAELISYLTAPIENAGLYKGLASLKELIAAYRHASDEHRRAELFTTIEEQARGLRLI